MITVHKNHWRDRLAQLVGVDPARRGDVLKDMLLKHDRDAVWYWLQLALATAIATLGLALNSTGVVIGAMLVAPLMGPLVTLGMSLATGFPYLTIRAAVRVGGSIGFTILVAAGINVVLPLHEITAEVAARTTPTLIDLFVAVFCALAAAFTTVRASSDTTATAAGTAIAIALVPPLSVVGFGIGNRVPEVAIGAMLLFTANLVAILVSAVLIFVLLGFDRVDSAEIAIADAPQSRILKTISLRLDALFRHRLGFVGRLALPLLFLSIVYIPLSRALAEVTWQYRVRHAIEVLLHQYEDAARAVQTAVTLDRHNVAVRLVVISSPAAAKRLESELRKNIAEVAGVSPAVQVLAVADTTALEQLAATLRKPLPAPVPQAPRRPPLVEVQPQLERELKRRWPVEQVGPLLGWRLFWEDTQPMVEVIHIGEPLGPAGVAMFATQLAESLDVPLVVRDYALPLIAEAQYAAAFSSWLRQVSAAAEATREVSSLHLCVRLPAVPAVPSRKNAAVAGTDNTVLLNEIARSLLQAVDPARLTVEQGGIGWQLRLANGPCVPPSTPPPATSTVDGGA